MNGTLNGIMETIYNFNYNTYSHMCSSVSALCLLPVDIDFRDNEIMFFISIRIGLTSTEMLMIRNGYIYTVYI